MSKEAYVETKLRQKVEEAGGLFIKLTDKIGRPDRIAVFKDDFYFVEVKSRLGRFSLAQKQEINGLRRQGFKVCCARLQPYERIKDIRLYLEDHLIKEDFDVNATVCDYVFISAVVR